MKTHHPTARGVAGRTARRLRRRHRFDASVSRQLRELAHDRNNWRGVLALLEDVGLIVLAVLLAYLSPWFLPVTLLVVGTRQRALATLLHEASHGTLADDPRLNRLIGTVAGWPILQVFHRYFESHVQEHHPNLGDEELDPDLANYIRQGLFEANAKDFLWQHLLPLLLGLKTLANVTNLVRDRFWPKADGELTTRMVQEYVAFAAFWAAILAAVLIWNQLLFALVIWFVAYFTVFQAANWLIELAEHFPLIRLFDFELEMTRNRRGSALEHFFTGMHGENWHLVHHLYPGIPFWRLSDAHAVMMQDPLYAAANARSGGLFVVGPLGEPSIFSLFESQLRETQQG